jgi:hypothetical protein
MGLLQTRTIEQGVVAAYRKVVGPDQAPGLCCTFEAANAASAAVWIQVLAGTVNMEYPFADDPVARLRRADAFGHLKPELIEWNAGEFATWDMGGIAPRDVAWIVDRLFTLVLGCDDATYDPRVTMEDLDT